MEEFHALGRTVLHNPNQNHQSFLACGCIVRSRKRSKTLMMLHQDLEIIIFVVNWDIGLKDKKALAIDEAYDLYSSQIVQNM